MKIKIALIAALTLAVMTVNLHAGQQAQTGTNSIAAASTNTYALYGDLSGSYTNGQSIGGASFINGMHTTDLTGIVGGMFTNTTAAQSNVTFVIAGTADFINWSNSVQTVAVPIPAASTNYQSILFKITNPLPGYGLRAIQNPTPSGISGSGLFFKAYTKNGI